MKRSRIITCATAGLALALASPVWAQNQNESDPARSNSAQQTDQQSSSSSSDQQSQRSQDRERSSSMSRGDRSGQQKAPEGFVLLDERVVYLLANEPQIHFTQAREDLAANKPGKAAAEIRLAAAYFDMQAARPGLHNTSDLRDEADRLNQLADQLERNGKSAATTDELRSNFSRAELALAQAYQSSAQQDLQQNRTVRAGHDLLAASNALRQAVILSKQTPSSQTAKAISDSENLANQLIVPTGEQQTASARQQSSQQQQANDQNSSNQSNSGRMSRDQENDQAMEAGARIGPNELQQTGVAPANADQTVNDLGNAIQQLRSQSSSNRGSSSGSQSGSSSGSSSGNNNSEQ